MMLAKLKNYLFFTTIAIVFGAPHLFSQVIEPSFSTFIGEVYKLPASKKVGEVYRKSTDTYEKLGQIKLDKLNIPETVDEIPFPQIERKNLFGIYFTSMMTIHQSGTYKFTLDSDDGSVLWIDGKLSVDNDGIHTMASISQNIDLEKGTYPIKVWYYNGVPNKYGLILSASMTAAANEAREVITFDSKELQFKTNSHQINPSYFSTLTKLAEKIDAYTDVEEIKITGHTDDRGSASFNRKLSLDRANAVKKYLLKHIANKNLKITVLGRGEDEPIASNDSDEGKAKNRRVEIIIK